MVTSAKIIGYVCLVFLVSCLLAPPLWWLVRALVDAGHLTALARFKFYIYFNRAVFIVTLVSIWPFLRWLGLREWTDLGLSPNPQRGTDLALGAFLGAVSVGTVAYGLVSFGEAVVRPDRGWAHFLPVLASAIVVPVVEEFVFRGALLGLVRRSLRWPWALCFISVLFAVLHFIGPRPGAPRITDVNWASGFTLLGRLFWQLGVPSLVIAGWSSLFIVGFILGYTVIKTRSLYMAIGLHGGWVLSLRFFEVFCKRQAEASFWVGNDIRTGFWPVLLLLANLAAVHLLLRGRSDPAKITPGTSS